MQATYQKSSFYLELKTNGYSDKVVDKILWEVPCGSKTWRARRTENKVTRCSKSWALEFAEDKGFRHIAW